MVIHTKTVRVLLLERNPETAADIQTMLSLAPRVSFATRHALSLDEGIQALLSAPADVILLDANFALDGNCFSKIYTQTPTPIVILVPSIDDDVYEDQLLKQQGVHGVLVKKELSAGVLAVAAAHAIERYQMMEAFKKNTLRYLKKDDQLQKSQKKIIEQERMSAFGQMASGVTHDFNNALMPVLGFTDILLNHKESRADEKKLLEYLQMISTCASDAVAIVSRLREFYRNKEDMEKFVPVNLRELVKQTVLLTQPKWKDQTQSKGVTIRVEAELESNSAVLGNEATLREALTNLIFNAVDAMPCGGTLKLRSKDEESGVLLEIIDSGVGMNAETANRCFEPFYSTKGKNGTGLGLAMVHGIVRRHEGEIEVHSAPGKGTTFSIRLPYPKEGAVEQKSKEAPPVKKIKPLKILLVDDDEMVRRVMTGYLERDGHQVRAAEDGAGALEIFGKERFDAVITDRAMPGLSGDQLAVRLKEIAPRVPVVMLTGFGEIMKAKNEVVPGVDWVMSKPATIETVRDVLARVTDADPGPDIRKIA